ncbi:MAG TPA: tetratricopeptide repeat protein, partial [Euryarchaeota archaeon]|nr:tetratricopeptide repeat protein [Euryarchaeota archaeon]
SNPRETLKRLLGTGILLKKNGMVEFSHALFQSIIYEGINKQWRSNHHKRIGETFEAEYAGRTHEVIYELARHFSMSNEHLKTINYCMMAGERAEGVFAPEQAIEFYKSALDRISLAGDARMKNQIFERLGDASEFAARFDDAKEYLEKTGYAKEEDRSRCMRKIANILHKQGRFDESIKMAAMAVALAPTDSEERIVARHIGVASYLRTGEYERANALMQEALSIEDISPELRGKGFHQLGNIAWYEGKHEQARDFYKQAYDTLRNTKDRRGLAKTIANMGIIYGDLGDLESAEKYSHQALDIYEEVGDKFGISAVFGDISNIAHLKWDFERAIEYQMKNLAICEEIGNRWGVAYALLNIASAYHDLGELEKAIDFHKRALKEMEATGDIRGIGMTLTRAGYTLELLEDYPLAAKYLERGLKMLEEVGENDAAVFTLCCLAQVRLESGEVENAWSLCERLQEIALDSEFLGHAKMVRSRVLAATRKEWENEMQEGLAHLDGDMNLKAEALYHKARLLAHTDLETALASLGEARVIVNQHHNKHWKRKIDELEEILSKREAKS